MKRPHYLVPLAFAPRDPAVWDRCDCLCHRDRTVLHLRACCDAGFLRRPGTEYSVPPERA